MSIYEKIKPIPTTYDGVKFRSRLEARWALVFNLLDIKWFYEQEGFDIDGTWYLPDFYLPDTEVAGFGKGLFCEVKPYIENYSHGSPVEELCMAIHKPVLLLEGMPKDFPGYTVYFPEGGCDFGWFFCIDNFAHSSGKYQKFGLTWNNRWERFSTPRPESMCQLREQEIARYSDLLIKTACNHACKARFH